MSLIASFNYCCTHKPCLELHITVFTFHLLGKYLETVRKYLYHVYTGMSNPNYTSTCKNLQFSDIIFADQIFFCICTSQQIRGFQFATSRDKKWWDNTQSAICNNTMGSIRATRISILNSFLLLPLPPCMFTNSRRKIFWPAKCAQGWQLSLAQRLFRLLPSESEDLTKKTGPDVQFPWYVAIIFLNYFFKREVQRFLIIITYT